MRDVNIRTNKLALTVIFETQRPLMLFLNCVLKRIAAAEHYECFAS